MENSTQIVESDANLAELQLIAENWQMLPFFAPPDEKLDEFQSVPDQEPAMPFTNQSLYINNPSLGAAPGWMDVNFSQFTDLKANSPVSETGNTLVDTEFSPAPSSTGSFFTDCESNELVEKQQSDENFKKIVKRLGVTEKKIQDFSVKDLNRFLKSNGLSKDEQRCLKNRRRTLKNRGYAQNCRIKRIRVKKSLEEENESLKNEIYEIRQSLQKATKERDAYRSQLHKLVKFFKEHKNSKVV